MEGVITVACVDDHPLLLDGICSLFSGDARFSVVARGTSVAAADEIMDKFKPEVLLLDLLMPGDTAISISEIASRSGETKIIIYTARDETDVALRCLKAGVRGFVVKDSLADELFEAVERVSDGEIYISRRCANRIIGGLRGNRHSDGSTAPIKLSLRESQVAALVVLAMSNKEIAQELKISEKTVKHYMTNLMSKFNARNRVEVALTAAQGDGGAQRSLRA